MTQKERLTAAEEYVRRVVTQTFNQKIDDDVVHSTAEKVVSATLVRKSERSATPD